jgi:hypothetical protein
MNWEVFGRKRSWPNVGAIVVFAWDLLKKIMYCSIKTSYFFSYSSPCAVLLQQKQAPTLVKTDILFIYTFLNKAVHRSG